MPDQEDEAAESLQTSIKLYSSSVKEAESFFIALLVEHFGFQAIVASEAYKNAVSGLKRHIDRLRDDCWLLVETEYIDKVYRDSYYRYYSSKTKDQPRNCLRVSVFKGEVPLVQFRSEVAEKELLNDRRYLGFFVLRPLVHALMGRCALSPNAIKHIGMHVCAAPVQAAVNGVKLECSAFPHASQDAETITCAETCVWEVVEYYGNKYQEHSTVLPSEILTVLKSMSYERQLPARGLNINQMSYALRKLGFSPRVYGRSQNPGDFDSLLACYVQSGLPLILAVETVDEPGRPKVKDPIGHAMLCVGYEAQQEHMVGAVVPLTSPRKTVNDAMKKQGIALLDYDAMKRRYVFIDDNQPVYQIQLLNTPCVHYPLPEWHPCRITYFLAPLPEKVYLEATGAKAYVQSMLTEGPRPLPSGSRTWLRTYHTSSRSLKHWLATKGFSSPAIRDKLMECVMPKFVWVTELSTDQEIKDFKSSGLVILDATEPRTRGNKAHIMSCYDGDVIEGSELKRTSLHLPPFNRFENLTKYEA